MESRFCVDLVLVWMNKVILVVLFAFCFVTKVPDLGVPDLGREIEGGGENEGGGHPQGETWGGETRGEATHSRRKIA